MGLEEGSTEWVLVGWVSGAGGGVNRVGVGGAS